MNFRGLEKSISKVPFIRELTVMVFVEGEKHQNLENNLCSKEESNNIISPHITNTGFEPELQCK